MLKRRTFVSAVACVSSAMSAVGLATLAWAQRPAQPIARPPGQRAGLALVRGRFDPGGAATGPLPGVYVVTGVDTKAETLQLRDDGGRTGVVHVNGDRFELESLQAGDEVEVDFLVPEPGSTRLEAGGLWKVAR